MCLHCRYNNSFNSKFVELKLLLPLDMSTVSVKPVYTGSIASL
jgi:hypothetical protein